MIERFQVSRPEHTSRAVALVAHGLNLDPRRMGPLVEILRDSGIVTVTMALAGHRGSFSELEAVERGSWLADFRDAVSLVRNFQTELRSTPPAADPRPIPVGFVGQSLGALAFVDFVTEPAVSQAGAESGEPADDVPAAGGGRTADEPVFSQAFFLSPALALRSRTHVMRAFSRVAQGARIPSAASQSYRLYPRLPAACYRALFDMYRLVRHKLHAAPFGIPTRAVMHPRDELVSRRKLRRLVERGFLPGTSLELLDPDPEAHGFHHLAVDATTMGTENWRRCTDLLTRVWVPALLGDDGPQ